MNKSQLIESIAFNAGVTTTEAADSLRVLTASITRSLKKGEKVTLLNFGTFKISKRGARVGHDPRNGQQIKIPARKVLGFTAGKALKDAVN